MSAVAEPTADTKGGAVVAHKENEQASVSYVPLGETKEIELTYVYVKNFLVHPTRNEKMPSDADIIRFMMLCKAQRLNPWTGDAFLTGYDLDGGGAAFSLITAVQALLKRAELCPEFDGIESGVVVLREGQLVERAGTIVLQGETLIGGWSKCWRKDRKTSYYQSVPLHVYDTKYSRWKKDPSGMIQKVAKAHVLREAFPNYLSGLKTDDEMDRVIHGGSESSPGEAAPVTQVKNAQDLTEFLKTKNAEKPSKAASPEPAGESKKPIAIENKDLSEFGIQLLREIQAASNSMQIEGLEAEIAIGKFGPEERASLTKEVETRKAELLAANSVKREVVHQG